MPYTYDEADIWRVEMSRLFAKLAHLGQTRKYTGTPYSDHPIRVSKEVALMGMRVEAIQAAALHDVKEDSPKFFPLIHEEFGFEVSDLVSWLTNPSKGSNLPRAKRKEWDRNHLAIAPLEVKVIKALDRLDNLRETGEAPEDFRLMYAQESRLLVEALNTTPDGSPIYARFQEILKMVLDECDKLVGSGKNSFKEHDVVRLVSAIPEEGLSANEVGAIVHLHPEGRLVVEFVTPRGSKVVELLASEVERH